MKLKKGDVITVSFIIIAIILYIIINSVSHKDKYITAVIKIDGKIYKKISLNNSDEQKEEIKFNNDGYMNIIYDNQGVYVEDVTCPDKICKKTGQITKSGQNITCMPNKIIIYIENNKQYNNDIDGVSY